MLSLDSYLVLGLLPGLSEGFEFLHGRHIQLSKMLFWRQVLDQSVWRMDGLVGRRRIFTCIFENDLVPSRVCLEEGSWLSPTK